MPRFLTHPAFLDVFFEVCRVQYEDGKRVKIKLRWWNKGQGKGAEFAITPPENFTFTRSKWREFTPYTFKGL